MSKPYKLTSAHEIFGFIDRLMTRCAIERKDYDGEFTIPYDQILEPKAGMEHVNLLVTINARWDGELNAKNSNRRSN